MYAYIEISFDHHGVWRVKMMRFHLTRPAEINVQEFEVDRMEQLFFDGEKITVLS